MYDRDEAQERQFIFYDLETTGLDAARDAILQATLTVTDQFLNEQDTATVYCRPRLDCVPSPMAYLTHFITPDSVDEAGHSEMTLAGSLRQALLSSSGAQGKPTTLVGYNNIAFDNEFLRHLFWRTLHDPYEHEWAGGNHSADAFNLIQLAAAFAPQTLDEWPKKEDGRPDRRLTALAEANGIHVERAHDAASDVATTIGLTRLVQERNPKMFDYWHSMSEKKRVHGILTSRSPFWHVDRGYNKRPHGATLACPVVISRNNPQAYICVDLRDDPDELLAMTPTELADAIYRKEANRTASEKRPGCFVVQANKQPMVINAPNRPQKAHEDRHEISYGDCMDRMRKAQRSPELAALLQAAMDPSDRLPRRRDYAGGGLYTGGFLSEQDRKLRKSLRALGRKQDNGLRRPRLLDKRLSDVPFEDLARNAELAIRCKYDEAFDELCEAAERSDLEHPGFCPYEFLAYYEHVRMQLTPDVEQRDERSFSLEDMADAAHQARLEHPGVEEKNMLDALAAHADRMRARLARMEKAAEHMRPLAAELASDPTSPVGRLHAARVEARRQVDADRERVLNPLATAAKKPAAQRKQRPSCAAEAP